MKAESIKQKFDPEDRTREYAEYDIQGHCLVIRLNQELDHHCATYVRERSDYLIDKRRITNIVFDFKKSHFMDSSGIGVIMGRYKRVMPSGGTVAVSNVDSAVNRIFELSGLYKIIKKYDHTEMAVRDLRDTGY